MEGEGQKLLEIEPLTALKCDRTDSAWILFWSPSDLSLIWLLSSSVTPSSKHCLPTLISNLGNTMKDVWKENRRSRTTLLPETTSYVFHYHKTSRKRGEIELQYKVHSKCIVSLCYWVTTETLISIWSVLLLEQNFSVLLFFPFYFFKNYRIIPVRESRVITSFHISSPSC